MRIKRSFGIALFLIGLFLGFVETLSVTGAVVGAIGFVSVRMIVAVMFIVFGAIFYLDRDVEEMESKPFGSSVKIQGLTSIVNRYPKEIWDEIYYVVDSSGAIDHKSKINYLINEFGERVIVPRGIRKELESNKDKSIVNIMRGDVKHGDRYESRKEYVVSEIHPTAQKDLKNYKKIRKMAKEFLLDTKKHKDYLIFNEYYKSGKKPDGIRDVDEYIEDREKDIELSASEKYKKSRESLTTEDKVRYINKHWKVGKGDIDVLSSAMYSAYVEDRPMTRILARDSHIKDAVRSLKKDIPQIGSRIEYIDYENWTVI